MKDGLLRFRTKHALALKFLGVFLLVLAAAAVYASCLQLIGNFHAVVPGQLYRSAQPSIQDIAAYHKTYGIKTIVNLRGENTGSPWYDKERAESRKLGIAHVDFRMSDKRELSEQEAEALLLLLIKASKPILIHCRAGADRSGLVAALYAAAVAKESEAQAEAQLSFRYGHVSIPYVSRAYAMDQSFEKLEPLLGYEHE